MSSEGQKYTATAELTNSAGYQRKVKFYFIKTADPFQENEVGNTEIQ